MEWELETHPDAEASAAQREASVQLDLQLLNEDLAVSWKRYGPHS